jgi:hypothetical protein
MAKKRKLGKSKAAGKSTSKTGSTPVFRTNLKFIGAAFDATIKDLENLRGAVKNKEAVNAKIATLEKLQTLTNKECPNNWYAVFE